MPRAKELQKVQHLHLARGHARGYSDSPVVVVVRLLSLLSLLLANLCTLMLKKRNSFIKRDIKIYISAAVIVSMRRIATIKE